MVNSVLSFRSSDVRLLRLSSILFACRGITCRKTLLFDFQRQWAKKVQPWDWFPYPSVQASKNDTTDRVKHPSSIFHPKILELYIYYRKRTFHQICFFLLIDAVLKKNKCGNAKCMDTVISPESVFQPRSRDRKSRCQAWQVAWQMVPWPQRQWKLGRVIAAVWEQVGGNLEQLSRD